MEKRIDFVLFSAFILLLLFGIMILLSTSAPYSLEKYGNSFYFLFHQIVFGLLPGLFLSFIILKLDLNFLKKYSAIFLLIFLIASALVFFPKVGIKIKGGARWINLGPFSFQPSEFLKLAFFIYLAAWLSSRIKEKKKQGFKETFFAFLILIGVVSLLLILQPDISTLGIILITSLVIFFLAKTPFWQTLTLFSIALILFFPIVKFAPYRLSRILVFLNPELDPLGMGYQIKQSLIAIGSGKILGKGFGFSQQKFGVLPQSFSDSIFAVFAEETGFLGCVFLIFLYLIFFWQSFKIGKESHDDFERLLAFGISFWIFFQAFFNIGAISGVMPLSGIPLPFISYGGSHLISEMIATTILLKISKK